MPAADRGRREVGRSTPGSAPRDPRRDPPRAALGKVRIIGGAWRRTQVPVPDVPGLRPTPDRVRETLFNWLGQRLDGWRCVDLFAGTGVLGLEAASRGAAEVVAVERDPRALAALRALCDRLGAASVRVVPDDAAAAVRRLCAARPGGFDLVFMDPPFGAGWSRKVMPDAARLLAPGGLLYLEAEAPPPAELLQACGLEPWRAAAAGQVHYHLLRRGADPAPGPSA